MQIGQVPYQFVPDNAVNDVRAITVEDDMSTMFPEPRDFSAAVAPTTDCLFCNTARNWVMAGAALVVFWTLRKGRR